jgi:hypothetical protein
MGYAVGFFHNVASIAYGRCVRQHSVQQADAVQGHLLAILLLQRLRDAAPWLAPYHALPMLFLAAVTAPAFVTHPVAIPAALHYCFAAPLAVTM